MAKEKLDIDDTLREMIANKQTITEMAKVTGCDRSTVRKHLLAMGLKAPVENEALRTSKLTKEKMAAALEFCYTVTDLAQHFQVHASTIRTFLNEYDLHPKNVRHYKTHNGSADTEAEVGFANATMATRDLSTPIVVRNGKRYRDITNLITE